MTQRPFPEHSEIWRCEKWLLNDWALRCVFNAPVPQVGDHVPRGKWNLLPSARGEWKRVCVRMNDLLQQASCSFHTLAQHVSVLWFQQLKLSIDRLGLCVKVHYTAYKTVDRCTKYVGSACIGCIT